jgi:predicted glycoside hydrolase/deacetylase ChbG (UPF0249 family)
MANGAAFDDAVAAVKANGNLHVGVHLTLTELAPVSRPREVPDLVDERGLMPSRPGALLGSLLRGRISIATIRKELSRQIEKVKDFGLTPTHLDSHQHVHALPQVLEAMVETALRHSIRWIRSPFDATPGWSTFPLVGENEKLMFLKQHAQARLVSVFRPYHRKLMRRYGLRTADHFHGVSLTGIWNEALVVRLVENLPPGLNELMIHPGDYDNELRQRRTRLLEQRETERDLFSSTAFKELLAKHGVTASSYGEIAA